MEQLLAGIIGALVGALITGLIAWLLQRKKSRGERSWQAMMGLSEILGAILSPYTPDSVKSEDDVWELQTKWGEKARELHLLGFMEGSGSPLSILIREYFRDLRGYVSGQLKRGELEQRRTHAKEEARKIIDKWL